MERVLTEMDRVYMWIWQEIKAKEGDPLIEIEIKVNAQEDVFIAKNKDTVNFNAHNYWKGKVEIEVDIKIEVGEDSIDVIVIVNLQ